MRNIPRQIIPLILLFLVIIAAFVAARILLIPETFGEYGHYRSAAVDQVISAEMVYAGAKACAECHDDIYELKEKSRHRSVSCEVCHGPAAAHVEEPDENIPPAPRERGYCPLCHGYNPSRPSGFPQILPKLHNPGKACMSCHNSHNPILPHAPETCSACHREIASKKGVSHHALLPCSQCHVVPEEHLVNPRFALAGKPTSKELCGECHSQGADSPREIPRIDLETHGGRYLCWDCHYPHYPEAQ